MSVLFLDTTFLVGAAHPDDRHHDDSRELLRVVATGRLGTALTSELVIDEAVTILGKRRGGGVPAAVAFARGLLRSQNIRCLYMDAVTLEETLAGYERYGPALSFTDVSSVVLMRRAGCGTLFSHDSGFDRVRGIVRKEKP